MDKSDALPSSARTPAEAKSECAAFVARIRAVADAYDVGIKKDDPFAEARLIALCLDVAGELVDDAHDAALELAETKEDEAHIRSLYNAVRDPLGELAHGVAVALGVETFSCESDE